MKPRSAKNKGKLLQNLVRDKILSLFPHLTERDVKSTTMGESGTDVQLSEAAFAKFPYDTECKSLKRVAIYRYFEQRPQPVNGLNLLVIKENGKKPLAVVDFEHFMTLVYRNATYE